MIIEKQVAYQQQEKVVFSLTDQARKLKVSLDFYRLSHPSCCFAIAGLILVKTNSSKDSNQ